ncbi:MAG: hypothetical protein QOE45_2197 [Frankiaceae bacterium]|jgi:plastocyanin|nr:hypothetical protein [Frankiaceae bacterium]
MLADRTLRLAAAFTTVLALTACSQGTRLKPSSKATPVNVPTFAPTVNPAPTTTAPAAPSESGGTPSASSAAPSGGGNAVTAVGGATNKFEPASLTVKAGSKVTWTAQGYHSADSGTPPTVDKSGPIQAPAGFVTYSVTFAKPGTYKYFCVPHASLGMVGEIVVT